MSRSLINQLKELEEIYQGYLNKTRELSHEQFNRKPAPDQWSAGQVLYHLWSSSDFTQTFMERRLAEKKVARPTGLKTTFRNIILHLALATPIKFKAPRALSPMPDEVHFQEMETSLKNNLSGFEKILSGFPPELENKEIFKHPRIGYINASQTLAFLKAHSLHHKPQLENLLSLK